MKLDISIRQINIKRKRIAKIKRAIEIGFTGCTKTGVITTPTGVDARATTTNGYIKMTIRKKGFKPVYLYGHQFVYYLHHGVVVNTIDHINGIKTDNRISNLRSVSKSKNALNSSRSQNVYKCNRHGKYISIVMINGKQKWLGSFDSFELARKESIKFKNNYINES